jgi:hypothetical protein
LRQWAIPGREPDLTLARPMMKNEIWVGSSCSPGISARPSFRGTFGGIVNLAMVAFVEAIFLSTFILITQNRMAAAADKRADLDLQINLLSEHEVTKLVALVSAIADRLDVKTEIDPGVTSPADTVLLQQTRLPVLLSM